MSVTIGNLAAELDTDPQVIADTARQMITSGNQKVLTVEPSPAEDADPVTCLTDHAAASIRTQLRDPTT